MPVKRKIPFDCGHFFITFTCYNWLHLLALTDGYDLVYNWLDILKQKGHYITGFVLMPNHVHAVIAFRNTGKSINSIIANGKPFMAYDLVKALKAQGEHAVLKQMEAWVNNTQEADNKQHEVFEPSF